RDGWTADSNWDKHHILCVLCFAMSMGYKYRYGARIPLFPSSSLSPILLRRIIHSSITTQHTTGIRPPLYGLLTPLLPYHCPLYLNPSTYTVFKLHLCTLL